MMYYIKDNNGNRWKVREAVSLRAACSEIAMARVTGSVGSTSYINALHIGSTKRCQASVVRVHSDFTEQQPYEALR